METIHYLIDLILNLNVHINSLVNTFGLWTYVVLFLIIFCETGLVIMPFLPGDSLLFAVGIVTATTNLNVHLMVFILAFAAILGDNCNYWIGHLFGEKLFKPDAKILKTSHLTKTHQFFDKYGAKAIIIARFVPIIRTFTPFAAGMGEMPYRKFVLLSVIAAFIWVGLITYFGYFFSNIPFMQDNFSYLIIAIIVVSVTPAIIEIIKKRRQVKKTNANS
ncbi:DedA family protein [Facilibium subflavum]|uniref:DedA family protein n=1 Tax=Facilibium subflavum TaxID=2219058 RepID=UPI000E65A377|nr:DedA family protein [Facilibium subflavum]